MADPISHARIRQVTITRRFPVGRSTDSDEVQGAQDFNERFIGGDVAKALLDMGCIRMETRVVGEGRDAVVETVAVVNAVFGGVL
jgi:hypothetical protein